MYTCRVQLLFDYHFRRHTMVALLWVSVECGPGSFLNAELDTCVLCEEGWYQPDPGRDFCLSCPPQHTTYGRGASRRIECCECSPLNVVLVLALHST